MAYDIFIKILNYPLSQIRRDWQGRKMYKVKFINVALGKNTCQGYFFAAEGGTPRHPLGWGVAAYIRG